MQCILEDPNKQIERSCRTICQLKRRQSHPIKPVFATMVLQDVIFTQSLFIIVYSGIYISKSSFVATYPSTNGSRIKTFPSTAAGVRKFIGALAVAEHHCVMEATSNYGCCCTCYIRTVLPSVLPPPKKKADQAFFPNDDARYQNRRKRRLHDRHVRGEDESSHLQNALAGYNTDPYHRRVYLL